MELARATLPLLTLGAASRVSTANTGSPCRTTRKTAKGGMIKRVEADRVRRLERRAS
jgi:hypothetical protein